MPFWITLKNIFLPLPGTVSTRGLLIRAVTVGCTLTVLSYLVVVLLGVNATMSTLEGAAVLTSYACTYLTIVQSRWNYPIGVITTALYAWLFVEWGLIGSAALNIYLVPVLAYGWFRWGKDKKTRPVTHVSLLWMPIYIMITAIVWAVCTWIVHYFGSTLSEFDTAILVLSVLAQLLLDNKKIETWIVWAMVNIIAIYVYASTGLWLAAAQYVLFLLNTGLAGWQWYVSKQATDALISQLADKIGVSTADMKYVSAGNIDTAIAHERHRAARNEYNKLREMGVARSYNNPDNDEYLP